MQHLRDLEKLEIEVLDLFNTNRLIDSMYFGGGTMLRLCHQLKRYSTDLDFWLKQEDTASFFDKIHEILLAQYTIRDAQNKRNTLIFEIRSSQSARSLVIELRKDQSGFEWEPKIAFSPHTNTQVQVRGLTLKQMMKNKVEALLSRKMIRDVYDMEFLLFRGIEVDTSAETSHELLKIVEGFTDQDFKVTLGSLLESKERAFCIENRFQLLREALKRNMVRED
jgi:predicted nucleotidyltransferase component of viral defense system